MNDKIKHLIAGFIIGVLSSLLLWWEGYEVLLGIIPVILAALGKEFIWDKWMGKGTFEWKDIYFTCFGGLTATILWYFFWQ